ncbi:MAG: FAD-binding oxidoreductase [Steroidobacteraceae bacterium]
MRTEFDVVIAGGGVMGSACAYFLRSIPEFRGSVLVVEPDPGYRQAASTRSAGSIRQQFSTPLNIALSSFGLEFLREAPRCWAQAGSAQDLALVESSYLFLATAQGRAALAQRVAIQQSASVPVTLRDQPALAERYPWLNTADLAAGSDTEGAEGWFDGHALLAALRGANERGGVRYVRDRVIGFEQSAERRILAARLEAAGRIGCAYAVNTAGTRSRELAASAGVDLPVFPRKRSVFVFTCPVSIPNCPLVIDPSGLWFRAERDRFLCGPPANPDPDVPADDFEVDLGLFESRAWPILAHRVPAFEAVRMTSAWAGHYDYNTFDQNAFVGPVPGIPNLLLACGFSGHGLQQAPGIGRGLAEYISLGRYRSLDLSALSYSRFLANAPLREVNVI